VNRFCSILFSQLLKLFPRTFSTSPSEPSRCQIGAKYAEPGELRQPPSRAAPRFLLGKIVGGLGSLPLIVTSDLRVGVRIPPGAPSSPF
jgi:hypothetical protein